MHEFTHQPFSLANKKDPSLLYQSIKAVLQKFLQEKFHSAFLPVDGQIHDPTSSALVIDGGQLLQQSPPRESKKPIKYYASELISRFIRIQFNHHSRIDIIFDSANSKQLKRFIERHSSHSVQYNMNKDSILPIGEEYNKLLQSNRAVVARAVRDSWLKLSSKIPEDNYMLVAGPDEKVYLLTANMCAMVNELTSNHIEADTRIFLHVKHISSFNNFVQVVILASDTDIIVLAIGFASEYKIKLYVHSSPSRKKLAKYIDCSLIAQECCDYYKFHPLILIALHALSGCDTTSFIRNISKQKIFRTFFEKPSDYFDLFDLYKLPTSSESFASAERLLIKCMNSSLSSLDEVRTNQAITHLRSKSSEFFLNALLPTTNAFQYHCKRVSVQCNIWFQSLYQNIEYPSLIGNGYVLVDDEIKVEWKSTPSMPDTNSIDSDEEDDVNNELQMTNNNNSISSQDVSSEYEWSDDEDEVTDVRS
ncbi:unnamed protein product [Didymodactylos carnosus]|uniref:Uncharacterized protein n=1 Tax=Didymodactylos carnosus TaxID=1234261 RepID=A0A8S2DN25_9BILA|nr:unnamed protein product [Didymodactylos carnosus]CAF3781150.1 unnamed protein product [Didymodactylos carnosus]